MITLENFPYDEVVKALHCEDSCYWVQSLLDGSRLLELHLSIVTYYDVKAILNILPGVYFQIVGSYISSVCVLFYLEYQSS